MKQHLLFILSALIIWAFSATSCEKLRPAKNDPLQTAVDNYIAMDLFDDLSRQASLYEFGVVSGNCPLVTLSTPPDADYPKGAIINFSEGCIGPFNRQRRGRLLINQSGPFTEAGTVRKITLENFQVDGVSIEGYRNIKCVGKNTQGHPKFEVVDSLGIVYLHGGETIRYTSAITREWTGGAHSPQDFTDDVWRITGRGNGTNRSGFNYTYEISEPLFFDMRCRWKITKGRLIIRSEGMNTYIDFGNGACNDEMRVTVDDNEPEIVYFQ